MICTGLCQTSCIIILICKKSNYIFIRCKTNVYIFQIIFLLNAIGIQDIKMSQWNFIIHNLDIENYTFKLSRQEIFSYSSNFLNLYAEDKLDKKMDFSFHFFLNENYLV